MKFACPVYMCTCFLPQIKRMYAKLMDEFKFTGVTVNVDGCLCLCDPVMDW